MRLLSHLLPRSKALGRDSNHAKATAGIRGEESAGRHRSKVCINFVQVILKNTYINFFIF